MYFMTYSEKSQFAIDSYSSNLRSMYVYLNRRTYREVARICEVSDT